MQMEDVLEQQRIEITNENPEILIVCYGTLRTGRGNWKHILENRSEYLGTFKSEPKFTMYGKYAGFPIVVDKGNTSIEYEVFKITSPTTLDRLHQLEGCTGITGHEDNWYDIIPIKTPVGDAYMYVQHNIDDREDIIKSGNWNTRNL